MLMPGRFTTKEKEIDDLDVFYYVHPLFVKTASVLEGGGGEASSTGLLMRNCGQHA